MINQSKVRRLIFLKSLLSGFGGNPNQAKNANPEDNQAHAPERNPIVQHEAETQAKSAPSGNVGGTRPNDDKTNDPRYFAYYHHMPCLNPHCASRGRPHPNCRCYLPNLAEGGIIDHFCKGNKAHKPDCEYFAEGGDADEVVPDQSSIVPSSSDDEVVPDQSSIIPSQEDHSSVGQQILTGVEGAAQGVLGPVATWAEKHAQDIAPYAQAIPGLGWIPSVIGTPQDVAARAQENPVARGVGEAAGLLGSVAGGVGLGAGTNAIAGSVAEALPFLGKIGSSAIKAAIPAFLTQGSDEVSKAMLGQGDPNDAVSPALTNMNIAALIGAGTGAAFGTLGQVAGPLASKALKAATKLNPDDIQLGTAMQSFTNGIGKSFSATSPNSTVFPEINFNPTLDAGEKYGKKFMDFVRNMKPLSGSDLGKAAQLGGAAGYFEAPENSNGFWHAITGSLGGVASAIGGRAAAKALSAAGTYAIPATVRMLSNSEGEFLPNISRVLNYAKSVNQGTNMIADKVNTLFQPAVQQAQSYERSKEKQELKDFISNGGLDQNIQQQQIQDNQSSQPMPHFAEGGQVESQPQLPIQKGQVAPLLSNDDPIEKHFPEHNSMLQIARSRIASYLTTQQPNKTPSVLPFDKKPDQKDENKKYDKALNIAVNPLGVLDKVKEGRLTPEDMGHFTSMYPELHDHLQKKITQRIVQAQLNGEKPKKAVRQSLSLFMGAPMDSSMTQPMLAAAQGVFASQQPQQNEAPAASKTKDLSKVSSNAQTASDASAARASQTE